MKWIKCSEQFPEKSDRPLTAAWMVNFRIKEIRDMKWNTWQKVSEKLPSSDTPLLFIVNDTIYFGSMSVHETSDGDGTPLKTCRIFKAFPQVKEEECCDGHLEPIEVEMIDRLYEFAERQVTHWMPLPDKLEE